MHPCMSASLSTVSPPPCVPTPFVPSTLCLLPLVPQGYLVDNAFEAAVHAHLLPASLQLVGLDCQATPNPSDLCQSLTADQALLLK